MTNETWIRSCQVIRGAENVLKLLLLGKVQYAVNNRGQIMSSDRRKWEGNGASAGIIVISSWKALGASNLYRADIAPSEDEFEYCHGYIARGSNSCCD